MRQLLFYLLLVPFPAVSVAADAGNTGLTLEQAVIKVLEHSPALKSAGLESKAAASRIRNAKLTPAPRTTLEFENFGGNGSLGGSDALETTLSLSKVFELGDKAGKREQLAQHEAMVLRNQQDAQRLDILADTAKRFIQVVTDQERLQIVQDSLDLAERTNTFIEQRVDAGRLPLAELTRSRIVRARKKLERDQAGRTLESSRLKLVTLWGETGAEFATASADLYTITEPEPFENLVTLLENNPELVRFASEQRLADTRIQLQRSGKKSNIEISGGIRHYNVLDETAFVASLGIPFGNRTRAAPKIEEAELLGQRNPYDYEQQRLQLYATLFEVNQALRHSIAAVSIYRDDIIPLAENALNDLQTGYAAGRYSLLELYVAQKTLLDARLELLAAAADYHRYRIEIERLTGAGLTAGVGP